MTKRPGDDDRRGIDSRRVNTALAALIDTPLDQITESHLDELDRALTPDTKRKPIPVAKETPAKQPAAAPHHEVGDADTSDADEDEHTVYEHDGNEHRAATDARHDEDRDDTDVFSADSWNATAKTGTTEHDPHIHGSPDDKAGAAGPYPPESVTPAGQSTDPALDVSAGLRELIARRGATGTGQHDRPAAHPNERTAETTAPEPATQVHHHDTGNTTGTPATSGTANTGGSNTAHTAPAADTYTARTHDTPIPLRSSSRSDTDDSSAGFLSALRNRTGALDPSTRKLLKFVAILLAVAVVVTTVRACTSGDDTTAPDRSGEPIETAAPAPTEIPVPDSAVGVLAPTTVSSHCPDGSTDARLAFGSEKGTAWICRRALGIDGALLEMQFEHPVAVTEVFLVPGFDYVEPSGIDRWLEHRVVTRAQWTIGDQRFVQEITPSRTGARMDIPNVETRTISLMIMETTEPSGNGATRGFDFGTPSERTDSFAISLIRITGHQV